MKKQSTKSPATLDKEIYSFSGKTKFKIAFISLGIFLLALFFHFPVREFVRNKVVDALATQRNCPIAYESIDVSFFLLPSITIDNPTIDSRCLPNGLGPVKLESIEVTFVGPSFVPPGLRVRARLKYGANAMLTAYWSQSFTKGVLKLPKTVLDGSKLAGLTNNQKVFEGKVELEGLAELAAGKLLNLDFLAKSSDLRIASANIGGFSLPTLNLETLFLKVSSKKPGQITIEEGVLGNDNAAFNTRISGNIDLNLVNMAASRPDLKGKIRFSNGFLEQFSIIKLLLSSKTPDNGYYSFELLGSFNAPNFKFL
jgi:type II secretion system protein N